ncbi:nuclease domain-containing protein [uncultured Chloroflexus sp.]|uniref:nuclease domain-containing protein n=1 Tax=uncultured Chloroflexus sp. TaxID=214040 RepID=UPI002615F65A|nr:nuclease domain-containing protein [uncultured Chloroflexus sp.]
MVVAGPVLLLDGVPAAAPIVPERNVVEWSCAVPAGATAQLAIDGEPLEPFLRPGDSMWRWRWQAPAAAGVYPVRLTITAATQVTEWRGTVHVAPSLLDARRYAALLADLVQLAPALAHALNGGRYAAGSGASGYPDRAALPALLTGPLTQRLIAAVERLARQPRQRRWQWEGPRELGMLRERPDPARWRIASDAAPLPPAGWPDRVGVQAYRPDPLERGRQVAAQVLDRLIASGQALLVMPLPAEARVRLVMVIGRLRAARLQFDVNNQPLIGRPMWRPRSRDERIVAAYQRLMQRRLGVGWAPELLEIPVREVARLYETWCVARVGLDLLSLSDWQVHDQSIFAGQTAQLTTQQPLLVLAHPTGATLALRYQPRYAPDSQPFRSLDDRVRVPDGAIEFTHPRRAPGLIVLDAKYRSEEGALPASAIDEGYSYLAGIGHHDGSRAVAALALLFPGSGAPVVYASGLTALPLLPGEQTHTLTAWLRDRILDAII